MISRVRVFFLAAFLAAAWHCAASADNPVPPVCGTDTGRGILTPEELAKAYAAHQQWLHDNNLEIDARPKQAIGTVNRDKLSLSLRLGLIALSKVNLGDPRRAVLCGYDLVGANLRSQDWAGADFSNSTFEHATIAGASFILTQMPHARFIGSDLRRLPERLSGLLPAMEFDPAIERWTRFLGANLEGAKFGFEVLVHANFSEANLRDADFFDSDVSYAWFIDTDLTGTRFDQSDVGHDIFEPKAGTLPNIASMANAQNLAEISYSDNPTGLMALRQGFRNAGFDAQARMLTYALRMRAQELDFSGGLLDRIDGALQMVGFELPAAYGLAPGRPLMILVLAIFVFAVPYFFAISPSERAGGIWQVPAKTPPESEVGRLEPERVRCTGRSAVLRALHFSLLSACRFGWRDFNLASLITRLQPRDYSLVATGWVRSVAGLQSLLSLYLIALWALCSFGRPFG